MSADTDKKLDSIALEEPLLKIRKKKESKKTLNLASIIKEKRYGRILNIHRPQKTCRPHSKEHG